MRASAYAQDRGPGVARPWYSEGVARWRSARAWGSIGASGLVALIGLVGCDDDGILADGKNPGPVDAGFFRVDVGPDLGPRRDAAPTADATVDPDRDAEVSADAEVMVRCECPAVPTSCPALTPGVPAFAPSSDFALAHQLFDVLACAETRLQIAVYETDWDCIVDALRARLAASPGLRVDMVIDDDQCPLDPSGVRMCALARLASEPRVTIVDDGRSRYMHHKFVVADGRVVWMGSANFTRVSYCGELNDALVVDDAAIVGAYADEFTRLFQDRTFGPRPRTPPVVSGNYRLYFGPESPVTAPSQWFEALVSAVDTASTSIAVMTYAWTRTELSDALIRAAARGVDVRALVPANYRDEPPAEALVAAGIPVRVARVHYKVLLVDDRVVATGSPNWSENAWTNNEASLWITSSTVAAAYRAHFDATFARAMAP